MKNPDHQYYFRVSECKAKSATDPDCICWHDEGTGPFDNERRDWNDFLEWRTKPAENNDERTRNAGDESANHV